jgi:hypothetical protein
VTIASPSQSKLDAALTRLAGNTRAVVLDTGDEASVDRDTDNDGRFDTLEVETRNFKGTRVYDASGIPLHSDNAIIRERIALDKENKDVLGYEITTVDHALTKPWTVLKTFRREPNSSGPRISAARTTITSSSAINSTSSPATANLMPTRKDQPPPDTRYFRTGR